MRTIRDKLRDLKVLQGPFMPFDTQAVPDAPLSLFMA